MNQEIWELLQIADHLQDHPNLNNIRGAVLSRLKDIDTELGLKPVAEPEPVAETEEEPEEEITEAVPIPEPITSNGRRA